MTVTTPERVVTQYVEPQWLTPRTRNPYRHEPWTVIVKEGSVAQVYRFATEAEARAFAEAGVTTPCVICGVHPSVPRRRICQSCSDHNCRIADGACFCPWED